MNSTSLERALCHGNYTYVKVSSVLSDRAIACLGYFVVRTQGWGAYLRVIHRSVRNFQIPPFLSPARFNCHSLVGCSGGVGGGGMMMFAHELTGVYTFFK